MFRSGSNYFIYMDYVGSDRTDYILYLIPVLETIRMLSGVFWKK